MAVNGSLNQRLAHSGSGCAVYFVLFLALAYGLDAFTAGRLPSEARPWVGAAAALFFTLGGGAVWGLLSGYTRSGGPLDRDTLLAQAGTPDLPLQDGALVVTGRVQLDSAVGDPLTSPIGGRPCVAYLYRMYYVTGSASENRREVPVYWGVACLPFCIAAANGVQVRVQAVPQLRDQAQACDTGDAVLRAKAHISATQFEPASGLGGVLGSAFEVTHAHLALDNTCYHRDWASQGTALDPATLILEETVLAVGDVASVAGPWSVSRQAIVPCVDGLPAQSVTARSGAANARQLSDAGVPPSTLAGVVTALVLLALGAAVLWGALALLSGTALEG